MLFLILLWLSSSSCALVCNCTDTISNVPCNTESLCNAGDGMCYARFQSSQDVMFGCYNFYILSILDLLHTNCESAFANSTTKCCNTNYCNTDAVFISPSPMCTTTPCSVSTGTISLPKSLSGTTDSISKTFTLPWPTISRAASASNINTVAISTSTSNINTVVTTIFTCESTNTQSDYESKRHLYLSIYISSMVTMMLLLLLLFVWAIFVYWKYLKLSQLIHTNAV